MKIKIYIGILLVFICILNTRAQDKIYKTTGEVIAAKIIEIGASEIKYRVFDNLNGPIYNIQKQQVIKIIYENGKTEIYENSIDLPEAKEKRGQNVFVELGGQGLVFTANYDTRFSNKRNGIGARIGIGAIGAEGGSIVTIPIALNYLLGNENKFFEMSVGATYLKGELLDETGSTIIGTMSFMYRLQPEKSGFSYRVGFTPIFNENFFIPYYFGLSLGYTF